MADWSILPEDLLNRIGILLETHWDVTRFRSVCASWRSSMLPKISSFPQGYPVYITGFRRIHSFRLSRRTIFLLRSGENGSQWLIKAKRDVDGIMHLINPFHLSQFGVLPSQFPKALTLFDFQVLELGQEIVVEYDFLQEFHTGLSVKGPGAWKTPLIWMSRERNDFALLLTHTYGKIFIYKSIDKSCTEIVQTLNRQFLAVASFRGKFYAIDDLGRTLVIDPFTQSSILPHHLSFPAKKMFLVESGNELLLIDAILLVPSPTGYYDSKFLEKCLGGSEKFLKFRVFKLDDEEGWTKVESLENRVLFIGMHGAFSVAAEDISSDHKRNCIIFREDIFYSTYSESNKLEGGPMHLFSLEDDNVTPLRTFSCYSNLFFMPPAVWMQPRISN